MPPGASDGAYAHGPTFIFGPPRYYEYTISEADFKTEAARRGYALAKILEPTYVPRYLVEHVRRNEFEGDEDGWEKWKALTSARIVSGLVYEWSHEDQATIFAFDRTRGRAYVYQQTR